MSHGPCKDCQKRALYCHGNCEEFKKFRAEVDEIKARKRQETDYYIGVVLRKRTRPRRSKKK